MKFLNKQEQVIDLQLTQYGKYLISIGKFKPAYYAFFDDGILYDSNYAYGPQDQKGSQERIKNETPQLEGQYNFRGIEKEVRKNIQDIRSQQEWRRKTFQEASLRAPETITDKQYALQSILGSSDLNTTNAPAWDVQLLIGQISSSARTTSWTKEQTGSAINIPQVSPEDVVYNTMIKQITPGQIIKDPKDSRIFGNEYIDVFTVNQGLLLDISEQNVEFGNDNFEIEVYKIEEEIISDGKGGTRELMIPLHFIKSPEMIKDGILLDRESFIKQIEEQNANEFGLDPSYVDYFLEIDVDNEIDKNILCKHATDKSFGIYSTRFLDCDEVDKQIEIDARNIYSTDITEDDLKDC